MIQQTHFYIYQEKNIYQKDTCKKKKDTCIPMFIAALFTLQGSQKEERERKDLKKIFVELLAENYHHLGKEIVVQEAQKVLGRINPRRNTPRLIAIKIMKIKNKDKMLNAAREKQQITQKGTRIRSPADFSTETLQARREQHDIFEVMKGKNLQPRKLPSKALVQI